MFISQARKIITRGVLDWDGNVLEQDFYWYRGRLALADGPTSEALQKAIREALTAHGAEIKAVLAKYDEDFKTFGSVQAGTKEAIAKLNTDGAKIFADHQKATEEKQVLDRRILDLEQKLLARGPGGGGARGKTVGEQFIESTELKEFAPKGKSTRATSAPFKLKNITSIIGSGGGGIIPEYLPGVIVPNFMPLTVRDLLDVGTTESNLIEWVRELVFTNAAGVVSEGALKPSSDLTYERLNVPVETIAHWINASKQVLADFKQLATLINGRMTFGLKLAEEEQILMGDGVAGHLQGIVPQATDYSGAHAAEYDTRIDVIRHAMLQVQLAFYPTTGIVMSPTDWHSLELTKDTLHRYIYASPGMATPAMLWGVPVVQSYSFEPGDFLVGAFKLAATLFDREEAQILVSTENQDNFIRNMVTILCEERLGLAVTRPAAFVYGSFPSGTSTT
jgi:HK97 family phage major capsid protein